MNYALLKLGKEKFCFNLEKQRNVIDDRLLFKCPIGFFFLVCAQVRSEASRAYINLIWES